MKCRLGIAALLVFLLVAFGGPPVQAQTLGTRSTPAVSPERLINPDGTLRLDGAFNGSLDLDGWNVQMDPRRGPVLSPAPHEAAATAAAGQWSSLGGASRPLDNQVLAVAVSGANVYLGGKFVNANGIAAADHIVKWDGVNWSALGNNGAGDGSVQGDVYAIAVWGSDVYVGGIFINVNNNGAMIGAADYVAKWDGTNWLPLGNNGAAGNGALNGSVYALAVSGTSLYAGGNFTNVSNNGVQQNAADFLARWNGANWSAVSTNGSGDGSLNGPVHALLVSGTNLYVGGEFIDVTQSNNILTAADYIARLDTNTNTWSALGGDNLANGALNNTVYALARDTGGNLYAGGNFTNVKQGASTLSNADFIAKWDGASWNALGTGSGGNGSLNGPVYAIAVSGSNVYAAGNFTNVNNSGASLNTADYVASWDGVNWSPMGSNGTGNGSLNARVLALAVSGPNLLAGGAFTDVNNAGTSRSAGNYFATWDGTNWSAPAATTPNGALRNNVFAIAVNGTNVYVGGNFTNVQNNDTVLTAADYVVKWDGTNWSALGSNGAADGSLNGIVYAIAVSGSNVYVGGKFADVNNNGILVTTADHIAKWDGTTWSALGNNGLLNGSLNNDVWAIAVSGTDLYVGGTFTDVSDYGTPLPAADYIARWNGSHWFPLLGDGVSNGSLNGTVYAIAVDGSNIYVGGEFTDVNNGGATIGEADYIAKWDGLNWSALGGDGAGNGSLNAKVMGLAVSGSNLYVGGFFTDVNNKGATIGAADYIAKWNGTDWSALGRNAIGNGSLNNWVQAIAVVGADVYVGGNFTDVDNYGNPVPNADHIAKWDGTNWTGLSSNGAGNGSLNGGVSALVVSSTNLYVGGGFTDVNNNGTVLNSADWIAAYELPGTNANLSNLALSSGTLTPAFATATLAYTANVANSVVSITVTPTTADSNATIKVNGTTVASGSASGAIALTVGANTITTVVTAQDGVTFQTYSVLVTRAAPGARLYLPLILRGP